MVAALALAAALAAPQDPAARPVRPPVEVQAEDVVYQLKDGVTVATGRPLVTLKRLDVTLTCQRAVVEGDGQGGIRRATCEGEVTLTRGARVVTCERAVYEDAGARITCQGNPRLRDGLSELTGKELVYELDADQVRLQGGRGTFYEQPGQLPGARRGSGK